MCVMGDAGLTSWIDRVTSLFLTDAAHACLDGMGWLSAG